WGIPTAITAFVIHAWNLRRLDAEIRREVGRDVSAAKEAA
ncbi:MAG TPA: DUF969 domain-containing protein, partial [Massilia timonae]|nr:DUF969 domain-containing protein [Massilia timonae]